MKAAVSVKLAGVFGQLTSLDVLEDACFFAASSRGERPPFGFRRSSQQPEFLAAGGDRMRGTQR